MRLSEAWSRWMRSNVVWRYFCNYFPVKVIKTVELDSTKSYLFIIVPHGLASAGVISVFAADGVGHKEIFPGHDVRPISLDQHFKIPLFREGIYFLGKSVIIYIYFFLFKIYK